jgi:hypothetical protein
MSQPNTQPGPAPAPVPDIGTGGASDHEDSISAGQNRPAPDAPADGVDNQGGARRAGIDYQRELGTEQDA